jgi:glucose-6-phosphate dehydrogenase assembly protein OpcA
VPAVSDSRWSARDTNPNAIEAALRAMLHERHEESEAFVPARALNLVCVVDKAYGGEIANRLRGVGRYHGSRTIVCEVEPGRTTIDAVATTASDTHPEPGHVAPLRETVIVDVGESHLAGLDTIVDPLVVSDLPTVLWAPHGHEQALDRLLGLAQVVLLDSVDDPDARDGLQRAAELSERAYVVDLAWLRSTPWRERIAATFDPVHLRPDLHAISAVTVRHDPESSAAALLLIGWLASRLGWKLDGAMAAVADEPGVLVSGASDGEQRVVLRLEPAPKLQLRGLDGLTLETATGRHLSLDRGPGGLHAHYRNDRGDEREWIVLGASRGEAGILGEGIRQGLLRDPTYAPALRCAGTLVP